MLPRSCARARSRDVGQGRSKCSSASTLTSNEWIRKPNHVRRHVVKYAIVTLLLFCFVGHSTLWMGEIVTEPPVTRNPQVEPQESLSASHPEAEPPHTSLLEAAEMAVGARDTDFRSHRIEKDTADDNAVAPPERVHSKLPLSKRNRNHVVDVTAPALAASSSSSDIETTQTREEKEEPFVLRPPRDRNGVPKSEATTSTAEASTTNSWAAAEKHEHDSSVSHHRHRRPRNNGTHVKSPTATEGSKAHKSQGDPVSAIAAKSLHDNHMIVLSSRGSKGQNGQLDRSAPFENDLKSNASGSNGLSASFRPPSSASSDAQSSVAIRHPFDEGDSSVAADDEDDEDLAEAGMHEDLADGGTSDAQPRMEDDLVDGALSVVKARVHEDLADSGTSDAQPRTEDDLVDDALSVVKARMHEDLADRSASDIQGRMHDDLADGSSSDAKARAHKELAADTSASDAKDRSHEDLADGTSDVQAKMHAKNLLKSKGKPSPRHRHSASNTSKIAWENSYVKELAEGWSSPSADVIASARERRVQMRKMFKMRRSRPGLLRMRARQLMNLALANSSSRVEMRQTRFRGGSLSQDGQELALIEKYLGCMNHTGTFVEIGAHNGLLHSNSYFLEQFGWRGICIEAEPQNFIELKVNRPLCLSIHAATAAHRGEVSLWHTASGGSSHGGMRETHDNFALLENEAREKRDELMETKVYAAPLHTLIQLASCSARARINLLSIGIEGAELEVLKVFDFNTVKVDVVLVECSRFSGVPCAGEEELSYLMMSRGFSKQPRIFGDLVFTRKRARGLCTDSTVHISEHPQT